MSVCLRMGQLTPVSLEILEKGLDLISTHASTLTNHWKEPFIFKVERRDSESLRRFRSKYCSSSWIQRWISSAVAIQLGIVFSPLFDTISEDLRGNTNDS